MIQTIRHIFRNLHKHVGSLRFYSMFVLITILSIFATFEPLFFGKILSELEAYYETGFFDIPFITQFIILWILYVLGLQLIRYII